ncbi:acetylglutamate kinase [Cohnella mopanensis]|uniref:acetylglutamate kinase n=1 Tax=Cohnella mopanensis TaxID=2911966 RepID=UPI001EF84143|nr:acetylglutamate kinase [Cohnella mopanensis]
MYDFPSYYYQIQRQVYPSSCWTTSMVELNRNLRALWEQHVYWTRLTVNSIVGRLPDEKETTARLLRNPTDFAAALAHYYGSDIANQFAQLFTGHLTIAVEVVKALQAGNTKLAADAQKRWYANADAIADFLSRINPYWSKVEWTNMLYEHLRLLTQEVATRLAGNYSENIALSDPIGTQALEMADVMTKGIVQQFPAAFQ